MSYSSLMLSAWNIHSLSNFSHLPDPSLTSRVVSIEFELPSETMSKNRSAIARGRMPRGGDLVS